mmetsp:Transcript_30059/g.63721  ORF Transcript_30059/g.63721 Transcript_30059/m.63721 type:complete len:209 (-) Transcript_30059:6178-6804(-)
MGNDRNNALTRGAASGPCNTACDSTRCKSCTMPMPLPSSSSAFPTNRSVGVAALLIFDRLPRRKLPRPGTSLFSDGQATKSSPSEVAEPDLDIRPAPLVPETLRCESSMPSSGNIRASPKAGFCIFCSFSSCTKQRACAKGSKKSGVRQKFWNEGENACRWLSNCSTASLVLRAFRPISLSNDANWMFRPRHSASRAKIPHDGSECAR